MNHPKPIDRDQLHQAVDRALALSPEDYAKVIGGQIGITTRNLASTTLEDAWDHRVLPMPSGDDTTDVPKARLKDITTTSWKGKDRVNSAHTSQTDMRLPLELELEIMEDTDI